MLILLQIITDKVFENGEFKYNREVLNLYLDTVNIQ